MEPKAQPIHIAVTGCTTLPGIDQTLGMLGKEKTIARMDALIEYIDKKS